MTATLRVQQCGPHVSLQDEGRPGFARFGTPASGPMDRTSAALLAKSLGHSKAPFVEISSGGLTLTCVAGAVGAALWANGFKTRLNDAPTPACGRINLSAGDTLAIVGRGVRNWAYVGFKGAIATQTWLGSASTYQASGLAGRLLQAGDALAVSNPTTFGAEEGPMSAPIPSDADRSIRVVMGPQERHFTPEALDRFLTEPFDITPEYSRMGARLKGPTLELAGDLTLPTEGVVRGALQVPGHGDPICLLADHQTTGGYPKIATITSADLDLFVQRPIGSAVRFAAIDPDEAVAAARAHRRALDAFAETLVGGDISSRLRRENLIDGVVDPRKV